MKHLTITMVPHGSWNNNLRSAFTSGQWAELRVAAYRASKHTCEICEATGTTVEAHEVWEYNEQSKEQKFVRLECLCTFCHKARHIGFALSTFTPTELDALAEHIQRVNGITQDELVEDIKYAFDNWHRMNKIDWNVIIPEFEEVLAVYSKGVHK